MPFRRRWTSIDRKLPLLASGLVLLTVATLGWVVYTRLQKTLIESAERRLLTSATAVAQMVSRPNLRFGDSATRARDAVLRAYLRGRADGVVATAALARTSSPADTTKAFAAFVDTSGRVLVAYRRRAAEPRWAMKAISQHAVPSDRAAFGPIENIEGLPAVSIVQPLRATDDRESRLLGYVIETRIVSSARTAGQFRRILGDGVELLIGQPGAGVWTDLEHVAAAPPEKITVDSVLSLDQQIAATAHVAGTDWMVWLSQPRHRVLTPARTLLWNMVPIGIIIALVSAAAMWRMARRITHPIVELTEAVEGVARDRNAWATTDELPATIAGADEVKRLRFAVERMGERLAEREALEQQLRQAQKMEAIGRLAGGVAHDFNNMLTAIRSYADLMLEDMPAWEPKRADVLEIRKAADRATALTAQLLAFSRKQMMQPRVLDTSAVLRDVDAMLRRLMVEDITLVIDVPATIWPVRADRGQLEQVIVNLAVNARDAMPNGGQLTIAAANRVLPVAVESSHGAIPGGEYVAIHVTDTGHGMDSATQSRVFEPFFTTKSVGQGTGLGLATVHGIVAQSGGYIAVESRVMAGSTFTVYLPRAEAKLDPAEPTATFTHARNSETILLVEDEGAVRALARRVLVRAGFRVLDSPTPTEALHHAAEHASVIKLVLSDVVMPEMNGPTLVRKVLEICPNARVLYISGYTDDEVISRGLSDPHIELLQKPFSAQELVDRVRLVLDRSPAAFA